jgi:FtsZ-interacting cell division protein YlmF
MGQRPLVSLSQTTLRGSMAPGETLRSFMDAYGDGAFENDDERQHGRRLGALDENRRFAAASRQHRTFVLIIPADFDDVQQIADRLKAETPVIVDLGECDQELMRRLLDFCSGLTYALDASLDHVGRSVVLLAPQGVELAGGTAGSGPRFFNQL